MSNLGYSFYPTHPGDILKEELEVRKISQRSFAKQVGMSYSVLNELLNGKRPLTPSTLRRGGKNIQKNYTKKHLHDPDNHDGVITHLEPDILECDLQHFGHREFW